MDGAIKESESNSRISDSLEINVRSGLKTFYLGWHTVALPKNIGPGGCPFCLICPCHEPSMAGPQGALFSCHNPLDMTRFPMIFWGPINGPGAAKKKRTVASLRNRLILFFSVALILMGAWQQIS